MFGDGKEHYTYPKIWCYQEAGHYLGLEYLLHTFFKSIIERTIEYFKDKTEDFYDYYPCRHTIEYDFTHSDN